MPRSVSTSIAATRARADAVARRGARVVVVVQAPGRPAAVARSAPRTRRPPPRNALRRPRQVEEDEVVGQVQLVAGRDVARRARAGRARRPRRPPRGRRRTPPARGGSPRCADAPTASPRRGGGPRSLSPSSGSLPILCTTSMRKPSTPRRSQKRSTSCIAASTAGSSQLRSGCWGRNECRYHSPVARVARPRGRAVAERRDPVVGRRVARRATRTTTASGCRAGARLGEPRVPVRRVVGDEVEQHPQPELVRPGDQRVGVGERAEQRVDVGVVGDVVAEVGHRRAVDRRQPDRVGAEVAHVLEARGDAAQVADAVAVGVRERARVDLVDDGRAPPRVGHRRKATIRACPSACTSPTPTRPTR